MKMIPESVECFRNYEKKWLNEIITSGNMKVKLQSNFVDENDFRANEIFSELMKRNG